jgi:hypothetical protein
MGGGGGTFENAKFRSVCDTKNEFATLAPGSSIDGIIFAVTCVPAAEDAKRRSRTQRSSYVIKNYILY